MKFKAVENVKYWWPVVVASPDPDRAGKVIEHKLELLFETQKQDDAIAMQEHINAATTTKERVSREHEALQAHTHGWRGVLAEDGSEMPFTRENFSACLQQAWFRIGVYRAYAESLSGDEARVKN